MERVFELAGLFYELKNTIGLGDYGTRKIYGRKNEQEMAAGHLPCVNGCRNIGERLDKGTNVA